MTLLLEFAGDRPASIPGLSYSETSSAAPTRLCRRLTAIARRQGMTGQVPGQADPLIPQPSLTLAALHQAVAAVAPGRLPEMFAKMQEAFVRAGEEGSVTPINMFYREWAVIVEIERHPDAARRLHAAEQALTSGDARVREAAICEAGEIVRAAHQTVARE
jgi:hypothetical protein